MKETKILQPCSEEQVPTAHDTLATKIKLSPFMVLFSIVIALAGWMTGIDIGYPGTILAMVPFNRAFGHCAPGPPWPCFLSTLGNAAIYHFHFWSLHRPRMCIERACISSYGPQTHSTARLRRRQHECGRPTGHLEQLHQLHGVQVHCRCRGRTVHRRGGPCTASNAPRRIDGVRCSPSTASALLVGTWS